MLNWSLWLMIGLSSPALAELVNNSPTSSFFLSGTAGPTTSLNHPSARGGFGEVKWGTRQGSFFHALTGNMRRLSTYPVPGLTDTARLEMESIGVSEEWMVGDLSFAAGIEGGRLSAFIRDIAKRYEFVGGHASVAYLVFANDLIRLTLRVQRYQLVPSQEWQRDFKGKDLGGLSMGIGIDLMDNNRLIQ